MKSEINLVLNGLNFKHNFVLLSLSVLQKVKSSENKDKDDGPGVKKARLDLHALPTRQYLDQTVVPILLAALTQLTKDR